MVKSSRPGALRFELNSQMNLLASQFSSSMGLGCDGLQALESNEEQMFNWGSTSSTQPNEGPELDSSPAQAQSGTQASHTKYSTLGFEVDLTGSQNSDTPYLCAKVENLVLMTHGPKFYRPMLGVRKESAVLKMREERFKKRRSQRLSSGLVVSRLLHSARRRLLTDLSLMVPGSIERMMGVDLSGNGDLDWNILQSWLEGQPELKTQMNLTTRALTLIATYKGPSVEAKSLQALKLYAVVACKLDPDTYKELCSFLFPEDNRFCPQGSC